jgi:D-sedoheptulose 7-phosphate isomerase
MVQHHVLDSIPIEEVQSRIGDLEPARNAGRRIFVIGNGGSAANGSHYTTDLGKNAFAAHGGGLPPFRVVSLTDNPPWISAISNDLSFAEIFVMQLKNLATQGDVLIGVSVIGSLPNLVRAFEWACDCGLATIALVGGKHGAIADLASHVIAVVDPHDGCVEDVQINILEMLFCAFANNA